MLRWMGHFPFVRVLLLAAPIAVFSWRTQIHHHRQPDEVAQANWLEDRIGVYFQGRRYVKLQHPVGEVNFDRPQLGEVLALLQRRSGVPFDVRWASLSLARVMPRTVLWARIKGMNLDRAIQQVCSEVGTYQGDVEFRFVGGVVVVARAQDFEADRVTLVYPAQSLLDYYEQTLRPQLPKRDATFDTPEGWVDFICHFELPGLRGCTVRCADGKLYITAQRWRLPAVHQSLEMLYEHPDQFGLWNFR